MKICIVSPHLDDALLSCGVAMQRHVAAADEVVCLNVFTAGARADERKQEDRRATAAIGAASHDLDELDAPDRDPALRSPASLIFGARDPCPALVARVERRVREFLDRGGVDVAWFPLAVGTHVDHRIVHAAGRRSGGTAVRYYEDRPYALWPGLLHARMRQLGFSAGLPAVRTSHTTDALAELHFLRHFVPAGACRADMLPRYLAAVQQPGVADTPVRSDELVATDDELRRLYACLALYRSQMPDIYPDEATFRRDSLWSERTLSGRSAYIERSWTLAPPA